MKIIVTGGAGFIGSHTVVELIECGYDPVIIDDFRNSEKFILKQIEGITSKPIKHYEIDCGNIKEMKRVFKEENPDGIIHFAADKAVNESVNNPLKYYENNVSNLINLIKVIEEYDIKSFVFSSSCSIYGNTIGAVSEKRRPNPKSYYAYTKYQSEKIIIKYAKKYNYDYAILRYFNIAGSSPSGNIGLINKSDHLFKNFSREIMKKRPVLKIYGNDYKTKDGSCIRDFIHVSDIAEIHFKVLEKIDKTNKSKILNCGYNKGTSVLEVAKEFKKQTSKKVKILITKRRTADLVKIIASNNKLMRFIRWKPKFNNLGKIVKSCLIWEKRQ